MLIDWKQRIEQLALDFLNGRAEVDPRDYPKTCEHCGLETLCRVTENQALLAIDQESDEDAEVFDE
jgi:ATP-dependent helicase/DNAse subunit B